MKKDRQTGRTTRQMLSAPQDAYYVWFCDGPFMYPELLAKHLKRSDLKIVGSGFFKKRGRGHGLKVVVDHAAILAVTTLANIEYCRK
jgi:hypothetical protein